MSSRNRQLSPAAKPAADALARRMIRELRAMRNPARAKGVQQYFKHAVAALGLDAPTLRQYARTQVQELRSVWTVDDAITLCDLLLNAEELEIRGTGILVLGGFRRDFKPALLPVARRWLRTRLDNWALVDSFCSAVASPLLDQHSSVLDALRKWSGDPALWVRRASLVTLVSFARRGRLLEAAYELAKEHFAEKEDLMHKATGWLLREAGKTDPPRLKRFLLKHGPAIPRTALRYAIERFPAGERAALLKATRTLS